MPAEQNSPQEIGVVTGLSGEAFAQTASGTRTLEPGSPIFQGEELVTGDNSNVEVRFVDDTLISQGGNSRISLDDYVYDPDGGTSSFLGEIAEGTFRTVTGKIAEQNPDRFKLGSPLATIGIRGTIILSEVGSGGEKHGVEEIHSGKAMLLQSKATGAMRQLFSGQMVDVSGSGLLNNVRQMSIQELNNFRDIAPANIRQEQEIREQRQEKQRDEQIDEQADEQNPEEQVGEEGQQEELPGDVDPGGGNPDGSPGEGGALHPGTGVLDPGGEALVGREKFDPDKINELPKLDGETQLGEEETDEPQAEPEEEQQQVEEQEAVPEELPTTETEEEQQQVEEQEAVPEELPTTETEEDTTETTTEGNNANGSDNSGSSSGPHNISGSGYIEGTGEADTITGSSSADTIKGLDGNDLLYGQAEDDDLFGGLGDDSLSGGPGEDMLQGDGGSNYLDGGSGESHETDFASFDGASQGVTVDLSNKNGNGEVIVTTADGQDTLVNIEGVIGTDHKDTLTGDDGINRFAPGLNIEYDIVGAEAVDGGAGEDWVQFENLDSKYYVNVKLIGLNGTAEVHNSTQPSDFSRVNEVTLTDIENIWGSSGNDSLSGNSSSNIIKGAGGNDIIDGGGGADTLEGGDGYDSIDGSTGNDSILGGDGNDFIDAGTGTNSIDGGAGIDSITYKDSGSFITLGMSGEGAGAAFNESGDIIDTFRGVEAFQGSAHNDSMIGSTYAETFDGNDGDDIINGHGGNDTLIGGTGTNQLDGGTGTDYVSFANASSGVNVTLDGLNEVTVNTGIGTDVIKNIEGIIGSGRKDTLEGDDNDNYFAPGLNADYSSGNTATYEQIDGGNGYDWIQFDSFDSSYYVEADLSTNEVRIKSGATTVNKITLSNIENVIGSAGSDIITASSTTASTIFGGAGNDTINLEDAKANKLIYTSLSEGGDTINNFENTDATASNNDGLYFNGPDFDNSAGFHTFGSPYGGDADANSLDAYFVFDSDNQLWYDSNGDDAGGQTLIAAFAASDDVTAADIVIG